MSQTKLSVYDIAALSGVSRSTVSRVLTGNPNVKASTRQRVLEVIAAHNFKPNLAARALVRQRTDVIALLIPQIINDIFTDPFFPHLMQAITPTASAHNYNLMLWLTDHKEDDPQQLYLQALQNPIYDGLIIASAVMDAEMIQQLHALQKPYILIGRPNTPTENASFLDVDNQGGATEMILHLLAQGRRRIGFIPGLLKLSVAQDRQKGYESTLGAAGLAPIIAPAGNFQEVGGYTSMKYLLEQGVDAVFASSDTMAMGALRAIREAGLRIPDDIAIGGFDDLPFASISDPPLTTIRQPIQELGQQAVMALIEWLEGRQTEAFQKVLPTQLIIRDSS